MMSAPGLFPRRILKQGVPALILAMIVSTLSIAAHPSLLVPASAAGPCDAPVVSKVACENTLPGNQPSEWQVAGAGTSTIQGYATSMSVNAGQTVAFKVKSTASAYRIDIYRLGYYQGLGARKIAANILPSVPLPQSQPNCATFSATGLIDCGNWAISASWQVPASAVSGVYLARLVRTDNGGASVIPFVVRDDAAHSDFLFQTSDSTWQAYNSYGGNSLYKCTVACPPGNPLAYKAAFKVSYNRPFNSAVDDIGRSWLMYSEYPMIRFMEANGYDVSYMSGLDVATKAPLLLNHKAFLSVGHDEYWSADQRANVEAARDAGVNLAFFSGNEMFWKTRWEASSDGSNTPGRTLVSYKDTHFDAPTDPVSWTGTWRDPRFGTGGGGGNPENALTGQFFLVNSGTTDIKVPYAYSKLRLWRNTPIASMAVGGQITLGAGIGTLGYEWDIDAENGFRPAGQFRLSSTTSNAEVFIDYGSRVQGNTPTTHNLTMYRAASGALVFGSGTVQWPWGLDGYATAKPVDRTMQQATVNLFADMGAQPTTLMAGLTVAQPSADTASPASTITSPASGASLADGSILTVTGTAADTGGVVAGVEVSTDGGKTWRLASGTTNWSYQYVAHGSPSSVLRSRAVDDSGNLENPSLGRTVQINCPCSLFGVNTSPEVADSDDGGSVELGAKFYSDVDGVISGIRFYKSSLNTGTHVGNIWSSTGQRLATATFTAETATGWQTATFNPPLPVTANTRYVASYFAPRGHYAQHNGYFYNNPSPAPAGGGSTDSAPLHFTRSTPGNHNGFYRYASTSSFPDQIYNAEYYWVDPIFSPSGAPAPPAVSSVSPVNNATGVAVDVKPAATFNQAVTGSSVVFGLKDASNAVVAGSAAYNAATNTATFTPAAALPYSTTFTATVSGATNSSGQSMAAPYSWTFSTVAAPAAPAVSSVSPVNNATGVAVDVKPAATFNQAVTGSSVVFGLKDASNAVVAGSAAYNAATNTATFTPAAALPYGTTFTATVSGATNSSGQSMAAPYSWTFSTVAAPPAPAVSSVSPVNNATGVAVDVKPAATFNQAVTGSSVVFGLRDASNAVVAGSAAYNAATNTATFTPAAALPYSTTFTATVSGATNSSGQSMAAPYSWTFTTTAPPPPPGTCPCSVFAPTSTPTTVNTADGNGVELGMKFRSDVAGSITGVRFYKGSSNTGTHTGHLWTSTGTLLASVTFTSETASGWQQANFSSPVAILANTTYVVSYYAPNGHYSSSSGYFNTAADRAPLHGLASGTDGPNGVYRYGSQSFPTDTYNNFNYWVDVVFTTSSAPAPPTVSSVSPVNNATGVAVDVKPAATFNQAVTGSSVVFGLRDASNAVVAGSAAYNAATNTATFTPAAALPYSTTFTATVSGATNSSGQSMAAPYSWTFTTTAPPPPPGTCPCSVFAPTSTPTTVNTADGNGVELGMKFRSDVAGSVTAIRFYKGSSNTGTHTGHLWSSTGTLLATVTFTGETSSGWQQANLSSPVAILANTTYVVSYYAPNGHYSSSSGYFNTAADRAPLHGLASGTEGANGVYRYGSQAFPTDSWNNTNYWVDVVFTTG